MLELFHDTCEACSKIITTSYSTSFSMGIRVFAPRMRTPIYSVYGFVRFADEIVDTFHDHNRKELLDEFRADANKAIERKISLNPVLNAFQKVVHEYKIEQELIDAFLDSMAMDLYDITYDEATLKKYIYGSAEVVGLMCLRVFCEGNEVQYDRLKDYAISLGSAFQKINFLRDMRSDIDERGRVYFPNIDIHNFTLEDKQRIEDDIKKDFDHAYIGIKKLPKAALLGVLSAYRYYLSLFDKIKGLTPEQILARRIRINNGSKVILFTKSAVRSKLGIL